MTAKKRTLRYYRHLLRDVILRYTHLRKKLSKEGLQATEENIEALHEALAAKNIESADLHAQALEMVLTHAGKKSAFDHVKEFFFAILFALVVAGFVRQMWFELYEIPTGSMRPTFREHDRVLVAKNSFGINTPFQTSHLLFNPSLVNQGNIIVFTGDGLDMPDVDTLYFMLFPGKKRYVKRCMGKPGDTLYFYGGRIYGVDKKGQPLTNLLTDSTFSEIEHIPFMTFDGKMDVEEVNKTTTLTFSHFHMPIGKTTISPLGTVRSELIEDGKAVAGDDLGTFWGINNFAMCRLISPEDLPELARQAGYAKEDALLYLELRHSPELPGRKMPINIHERYTLPTNLVTSFSWIPLNQGAVERLQNALYTSRFDVVDHRAIRYGANAHEEPGTRFSKEVPPGTYEFIDGKAYKINFLSYAELLPASHPIYPHNKEELKRLFNSGIELSDMTNPIAERGKRRHTLFPRRYAYFRDGALFVMGKPLFEKGAAPLEEFELLEDVRSRKDSSYKPFIDQGAPLKEGVFDVEFIRMHGLHIPEKNYLALGDNHSMSLDSRIFGFVPEDNLQGSPLLTFWPAGPRFGVPSQPEIPFWRIENLYVLLGAGVAGALSLWYFRRQSSYEKYLKLKK